MLNDWRIQRARARELDGRYALAAGSQRRDWMQLKQRARGWLGQTETLAWLSVTGFVWFSKVQNNRRAEVRARPMRDLVAAAWLVLSWRRLPERVVRRLTQSFDPGQPAPANQAGEP